MPTKKYKTKEIKMHDKSKLNFLNTELNSINRNATSNEGVRKKCFQS